jgi:hypothetical protein
MTTSGSYQNETPQTTTMVDLRHLDLTQSSSPDYRAAVRRRLARMGAVPQDLGDSTALHLLLITRDHARDEKSYSESRAYAYNVLGMTPPNVFPPTAPALTAESRTTGTDDEPVWGWITVDAQELAIRTPRDLASLLRTVMQRADLKPGQVAQKTGIHRSQVYLLTKPERDSLPRNPDQLSTFMTACRMRPEDIGVVLARWEQLDDLRWRRLPRELPPPELLPEFGEACSLTATTADHDEGATDNLTDTEVVTDPEKSTVVPEPSPPARSARRLRNTVPFLKGVLMTMFFVVWIGRDLLSLPDMTAGSPAIFVAAAVTVMAFLLSGIMPIRRKKLSAHRE